jgi:hypothetical protein
LRRWRLSFLWREGLTGYDDGSQFIISYHLFRRAHTPV